VKSDSSAGIHSLHREEKRALPSLRCLRSSPSNHDLKTSRLLPHAEQTSRTIQSLQCVALALSLGCEAEPACRGEACAVFPKLPLSEEEIGEPPEVADGWDDAPGSGRVFVVNSFAIAGAHRGENVDGLCDEDGCIDNVIWTLGAIGNDVIRQGLLGGGSLMLIEIAGVLPDYRGWDRSVTVKLYAARDADDPFFPANNFEIPLGHTTCCMFELDPISLVGGQARSRLEARIVDGRLETIERSTSEFQVRILQSDIQTSSLDYAAISFDVSSDLRELSAGLLTGVWLTRSLAKLPNPYCTTAGPQCSNTFDLTMLELLSTLGIAMDIDVDGDGLECVLDSDGDAALDRCCSTCSGTTCTGSIIPPVDRGVPSSCALVLSDGFSAAFSLTAVRASIVGAAP
jgi:hypothetical protein